MHREHVHLALARRRARERGQGLVEFSLMVLFLTILLMGLLDVARAYYSYLALKDAAQEGAYFGSAFPQCVAAGGPSGDNSADVGCANPNNIPYRVQRSAPRGSFVNMNDLGATITVQLPNQCLTATCLQGQVGQTITVTVSYQYQLITPFVGSIANGQTLTLTAQSSAVIIRVPDCTVAPCQ